MQQEQARTAGMQAGMQSRFDAGELGLQTAYLTAFARRRLDDLEAARDAVQDTLLAALSAPQTYSGAASLRTWLTGILKHKIADRFRDGSRAPSSLDDAGDELATIALPESEQPEARFERARIVALASRQLERMPQRAAQAFVMTEIEGGLDADVARSLGVSGENLSVMRFRARQRLREALRGELAA
jgi:RNA polymerase sigma-70 factor (ECF subfamily)